MAKDESLRELTPDELDEVVGGFDLGGLFQKVFFGGDSVSAAQVEQSPSEVPDSEPGEKTAIAYCEVCKTERTFRIRSGGRAYCKVCNTYKFM